MKSFSPHYSRVWRLWIEAFLLVYIVLGLYTELVFIQRKPLPDSLMQDFKIYEVALLNALRGSSPYRLLDIGSGYLYPPPALFLVEMFSLFTPFLLRTSFYMTLNITIMVLIVYNVARYYGYNISQTWYWYAISLGFAPFMELLHIGQINVLALFGLFLFFLYDENSPTLSCLGLALAVLIKVSPLLFFGYLLARRRYKHIGIAMGMMVLLVFLSMLRYKITFTEYLRVFRWLTTQFVLNVNSQSLVSKICWLEQVLSSQHIRIPGLSLLAANRQFTQYLLSLYTTVVVLVAGMVSASTNNRSKEPAFITTALGMTLLPNIMWYHHYVFLILPLVVWMGWSRLDRKIVFWCLAGLLITQIDRYHLTYGLLVHVFGHVSIMVVLCQQMKKFFSSRHPTVSTQL